MRVVPIEVVAAGERRAAELLAAETRREILRWHKRRGAARRNSHCCLAAPARADPARSARRKPGAGRLRVPFVGLVSSVSGRLLSLRRGGDTARAVAAIFGKRIVLPNQTGQFRERIVA